MFNFSVISFLLIGIWSLVQVTTSQKVNACSQGWPSTSKFESQQQVFNIYGSCCKPKCKIPEGYSLTTEYGAYKFHKTASTWNNARKTCVAEGAHLAVFTTLEETTFIQRASKQNGLQKVWIGYHDIFQEGDWTTVWDKPIGNGIVAAWLPNQPDNYNGAQNCGMLHNNGIDDLECSVTSEFVCKFSFKNCEL